MSDTKSPPGCLDVLASIALFIFFGIPLMMFCMSFWALMLHNDTEHLDFILAGLRLLRPQP